MEKKFNWLGADHIGMVVKDLQVSKKFYTEVLGMELVWEDAVQCPTGLIYTCFVKRGNLIIDLEQMPTWDPTLKDGFIGHIAFEVDDFEAAEAYLKEKGCKFDNAESTYAGGVYDTGVRFNFFRGPDGEMLELFKVYYPEKLADYHKTLLTKIAPR